MDDVIYVGIDRNNIYIVFTGNQRVDLGICTKQIQREILDFFNVR